MTQAEWLACDDPTPMLEFLRGLVSERKWRLLACAFSRRDQYELGGVGLQAIEVAECLADGQASETDRTECEKRIQSLIPDDESWSAYSPVAWALHIPKGG